MVSRVVRAFRELRWASGARSATFALVIAVDVFARPVTVSCQGPGDCHHVPDQMNLPDPQGRAKLLPTDAICTDNNYTDTGIQTVPDGGYLKAGIGIRIDTEAHTTGTCYQYMFNWWLWTCQYSGIAEMQPLQKVDIYLIPPSALPTHIELGAAYPSRSLSTFDGDGIIRTTLDILGEHKFTFQSTAYGTACTDVMTSNLITRTVNVLQCGPHFSVDQGTPLHLPLGLVHVYVPSDLYDDLWNRGPTQVLLGRSLTSITTT